MKHYITPEEHARMQRRRGRQALGLLVAILVIVGFVTVLRAGVGAVANLFDDTAQKQEYEDKLEGLVLFDENNRSLYTGAKMRKGALRQAHNRQQLEPL